MPIQRSILSIDTHELAWAAGFFDGEGCITYRRNRRYLSVAVSIAQANKEPLDRFRNAVLNLGVVRGPYAQKSAHHRPYWVWSTDNTTTGQAVVAALWRWLSEPKRRDAERVLGDVVAYQRSRLARGSKGRAKLSMEQVTRLRAEHAAALVGRQRVPRGFMAKAAQHYGVAYNTARAICAGRGYE